MKRLLFIGFFVTLFIGFFVPVSVQAKQKTINTEIECDSGEVLECSFPYYSKWKIDKKTLNSDKIKLTTANDDDISIEIYSAYDEDDVGIVIQGLSDKKSTKELLKYLYELFEISDSEAFSNVFKVKKDTNGKYLLIVNMIESYSVMKVLDDEHVLMYTFESNSGKVSKTQRKRILSYSKKSKITVVKSNMEGNEMSDKLPEGKWFDKNGNTMLEFKGDKMYATWWSGMEEPEEFKVKIVKEYDNNYIVCVGGEYGSSFGIMSRLQIEDDGTLTAYEEILDGESHRYKFVPEDRIEAERAVKDFSKDMPKTIESKEIASFSLVLCHYNVKDLGSGTYSWEIRKDDEDKYISEFSGMGSSYVIMRDTQEVNETFMKGLLELIEEEKVAENNGLFFSHDENDVEYSLYIRFESGERITIRVGSKALDKWPIDNEKFIDYAFSILTPLAY